MSNLNITPQRVLLTSGQAVTFHDHDQRRQFNPRNLELQPVGRNHFPSAFRRHAVAFRDLRCSAVAA